MISLGLSPRDFWRLSFEEWRWLIAPANGDALTHDKFRALAQQYPDEKAR